MNKSVMIILVLALLVGLYFTQKSPSENVRQDSTIPEQVPETENIQESENRPEAENTPEIENAPQTEKAQNPASI